MKLGVALLFGSVLALSSTSAKSQTVGACYNAYNRCVANPDGMNCEANLDYCLRMAGMGGLQKEPSDTSKKTGHLPLDKKTGSTRLLQD